MHGTNVADRRAPLRGRRADPRRRRGLAPTDRPRRRVTEAQLAIFEAPRYFEQLVVGRTPDEVLDIVARICGICPIAYQMSAVHAFEDLAGDRRSSPRSGRSGACSTAASGSRATPSTSTCSTRPTSSGVANAVELAALDRPAVERGLALKKAGNRIVAVLGGRPIHPVSVRVGGFSKVPTRRELEVLRRTSMPPSGTPSRPSTGWRRFAAPDVRARRAVRLAAAPDRVPDERGPDRLVRRPRPRADRLGDGLPRGTGALVARPPGAHGRSRPLPARAGGADHARRRAAPSRGARLRSARIGLADADPAESVLEHRGARGRTRPRGGRGDRHRRWLRPAGPRRRAVDARTGDGVLGDRGAARAALPPLRAR